MSAEDRSTLGPAPSLTACLDAYGVPRQYRLAASQAFAHWLRTWSGLNETPDSLAASVDVR